MTKTKYADQKTRQLLDLALRYGFTCRKLSDNLSAICAKNTDGESVSWIVYDRSEDELSVRGNTDNPLSKSSPSSPGGRWYSVGRAWISTARTITVLLSSRS